jgi:hypothetical protein
MFKVVSGSFTQKVETLFHAVDILSSRDQGYILNNEEEVIAEKETGEKVLLVAKPMDDETLEKVEKMSHAENYSFFG